MSRSDTLIEAADMLADDVYQRTIDGGWGLYKLQLGNALDALTSEVFFCRQHRETIDEADPAAVDRAIASCGKACGALETAHSDAAEQQAIGTTYVAIKLVADLLPPEACDLI